jgi:hypothetical protein
MRKIMGDQAVKLSDREQEYAEQGSVVEGRNHSTTVQANLEAAWIYHEQSFTTAGKAEPVMMV